VQLATVELKLQIRLVEAYQWPVGGCLKLCLNSEVPEDLETRVALSNQAIGYWFFQYQAGEPDGRQIDTQKSGAQLQFERWPFGTETRPGDIVYLWRSSGGEVALKGWATVFSQGSQNSKSATSLGLLIAQSLEQPIPRVELYGFAGLSDAPLIRQLQTGAYFRLSVEQAFGVAEFLRTRNVPAPEIAIEALMEPITRRIERELAEMPKLLGELRDSDLARQLLDLTERSAQALRDSDSSQGALARYDQLESVAVELERAVAQSREQGSSVASPLDAARTRFVNDITQLRRFRTPPRATEPSQPNASASSSPAATPMPVPAPQPGGLSGLGAGASAHATAKADDSALDAIQPEMNAPASPALAPPKDPSFRFWEQRDFIGIGAAVNNLARYISHEGLVPPRAIGVFGDWGSGKTFFIDALQSQIALLASQSRDALKEKRTTVFCSHIVQIEFNAWHYVESNLWASLAAHIFERLYNELERRAKEEEGNDNVDGLFQQFSAYRQAVNEQKRLNDLVTSLTARRKDLAKRKLDAERDLGVRLVALGSVLSTKLQALATEKLTPGQRKQLDDLLTASNLAELRKSAAEAEEVVRDGRTFSGRVRAQVQWWGWPQMLLLGVIAAIVLFGLPLLAERLFESQHEVFMRWMVVAGGYVLTAAGAIAKLARGGRSIVSAAQKVQSVLDETRKQVEEQPDEQLTLAQQQLQSATSELELLDQEVVEQRAQLAKLSDDLDPNRLGMRLREFLERRAKEGSYQKHLGLVSLVRKDFESLYDLMRRHWDSRKKPTPEVLAEVKTAIGDSEQMHVPFIERIVLYIDDLDRCPEDKVVEVLQAVHLMLGLPLFVVVVAVDVRWVGQSIRKVYGDLVNSSSTLGAKSTEGTASADDYLEKIFQIPYRIHPMSTDTRRELLGGLLREPFLAAAGTQREAATPTVTQQELVPKELSLYPQEQTVISELYACVGDSPRRVRRFFDVYRLMRSGMEEGDVQVVIVERHYEIILGLFAMLSGAPQFAPRVIAQLYDDAAKHSTDAVRFNQLNLVAWFDERFPITGSEPERHTVLCTILYLDQRNFLRDQLAGILQRWIPEVARYSFREVKMGRAS